jgi:hypothetical protein
MVDRNLGRRSWPLSPYEVNVTFEGSNRSNEAQNWFGPLDPITPLAPSEVAGRQWDYPAGYNLSTLSRPFEPVTFSTLRNLADSYDLLRVVIETRKDQVSRQTSGQRRIDERADVSAIYARAGRKLRLLQ